MSSSSAPRDRATQTAAISSSAPEALTIARRAEPERAPSWRAFMPTETCGLAKSGCRKASSAAAFEQALSLAPAAVFCQASPDARSSVRKASWSRTPGPRFGTEFSVRSRLNLFFALVILRLTAQPAPCHRRRARARAKSPYRVHSGKPDHEDGLGVSGSGLPGGRHGKGVGGRVSRRAGDFQSRRGRLGPEALPFDVRGA